MDPHGFRNFVDPFGGMGMAGDPMEQVLSLQTYEDSEAVSNPTNTTNGCRTCGCTTNTCDTTGCTFSCAAATDLAVGEGAFL